MELESGKEGLRVENGAFTYFGVSALAPLPAGDMAAVFRCPRAVQDPESGRVTQQHRAKNHPQQPDQAPEPPEHRAG